MNTENGSRVKFSGEFLPSVDPSKDHFPDVVEATVTEQVEEGMVKVKTDSGEELIICVDCLD
jgi:hypothetical protein